MQGLPGQTLPGTAGERGLPGEKVSQNKPLALKNHSPSVTQDRVKISFCHSNRMMPAVFQGNRGDKGAASTKGERVSTITLQSNTYTPR